MPHRKLYKCSIALIASFLIQCNLQPQIPTAAKDIPLFISSNTVNAASFQALEAQELFSQAYSFYIQARPMTALGEGSKPYAEAIRSISQAVTMEPENVDYLLLASQIYRGKGGLSFAKEYFTRAEFLLQKKILEHPDSIGANLDYAVLCYAGDVRYWPNYDDYLKKAKQAARHVISLCEKEKDTKDVQLPLAFAHLILGNSKKCEQNLEIATNSTCKFYHELFLDTVKKEKWFWPTKNADKEFLLYYMTDSGRNSSLPRRIENADKE